MQDTKSKDPKPKAYGFVNILYPLPDDEVPIREATTNENTCTGSFYCRCFAKDGEIRPAEVVGYRYDAGQVPDQFPPAGRVVAYEAQFSDNEYEFEIRGGVSREIAGAEGECPAPGENNNRVVVWARFPNLSTPSNPQGWLSAGPHDFKGKCVSCDARIPSVSIDSPLTDDPVPINSRSPSPEMCIGPFIAKCQAHDLVDRAPCVVAFRYPADHIPPPSPPSGAVSGHRVAAISNEFEFLIPNGEGECPLPEASNNSVVVWAKFPHLQSTGSSPIWHLDGPRNFKGECAGCSN